MNFGPHALLTLYFLFMLIPSIGLAHTSPPEEELIQSAMESKLHDHPYWKKLLHYKQNKFLPGYHSEVVTPEFFLAADGIDNSPAELEATIRAFFQPADAANPDAHAQCRFPARLVWLGGALPQLVSALPPVACPKFSKWMAGGKVRSLSVIFASGYLKNPASFYGHILLRLNTTPSSDGAALLNDSLNYGAIVPTDEDPISYIFKGLFGGYDAGFTNSKFYRHNHNYGEIELRDLWSYELDLTPEETTKIVLHGWELLNVRFTYYFLSRNCEYQMEELLELVVQEPQNFQFPWNIPVSLFNWLNESTHHGHALIKSVQYIPSRQNKFHASFDRLRDAEKNAFHAIIAAQLAPVDIRYNTLPALSKTAVTNATLEYYGFANAIELEAPDIIKSRQRPWLLERFNLPSDNASPATRTDLTFPHLGNKPITARVSALTNSEYGFGLSMEFRPAYFDHLSLAGGTQKASTLEMGSAEIGLIKDAVYLRKLHLLNIETWNASHSGAPGDGGDAWKIQAGFERHANNCVKCMDGFIRGGIGKSYALFDDRLVTSALADLGLHNSGPGYNVADFGVSGGLLWNGGRLGSALLRVILKRDIVERRNYAPHVELSGRVGAARDWDIRLAVEIHEGNEYRIGYSRYW